MKVKVLIVLRIDGEGVLLVRMSSTLAATMEYRPGRRDLSQLESIVVCDGLFPFTSRLDERQSQRPCWSCHAGDSECTDLNAQTQSKKNMNQLSDGRWFERDERPGAKVLLEVPIIPVRDRRQSPRWPTKDAT